MITTDDVIEKMIEIEPLGGSEGFLKIKETLTRMGVASRQQKILNQSAHILHRRGKYYICHFKEMFALDGLRTDISDSDLERRNRIAKMLEEWGLIKILDPKSAIPVGHPSVVRVIKYSERDEWELRAKYSIGGSKVKSYE